MASTRAKSSASSTESGRKPAKQSAKQSDGPSRAKADANKRRIGQISSATSQIVKEAGAVLDEEMAIGIVTAKKMQERFDNERRIDSTDFKEALQRFQNDGHELVGLVDQQIVELRSDENVDLTNRLIANVHSLLDLAVGLVGTGTEIANQLIERNLPKRNTAADEPESPPTA
jgi:hypothetical protein